MSICWFGNLPTGSTADAIQAEAGKAGKVTAVEVDRRGRMAWITYSSPAEAQAATKLTGTSFNGRDLRVEIATRDPAAPKVKKATPDTESTTEPRPVFGDRISVRGLPRETKLEDVNKFFATVGEIKRSRIAGPMTMVEFTTNEAATKALEFHGKPFPGTESNLRINLTTRRGPRRTKKTPAQKATTAKATKATPSSNAGTTAKSTGGKSRRVTVTLEPTGASADVVQGHFATAGEIYKFTANEDGTFTVIFTTAEAADAAIAKTGSKLSNAVVTVKASSSRKRTDRRRRNRKGKEAGDKPADSTTTTTTASPKKEAGAAKKRTSEPAVDLSNYVYVGGLTEGSDDAAVRKLLSSFGKIAEVNVTTKTYKDGTKKNFATVHFDTAAAAEKAIANGASKAPGLVVEKAARLPKVSA